MSAVPTRRTSPLREVSPELAHCSTERRFELLGQAHFFSHLSEAELTEVNSRFQEVHYGAGDWIWHPGDEAREMFIVAAGQVKLLQHGADGKDVLFSFAGTGDLIGGLAAVGDTSHPDGAQAHTECCLLRIMQPDFQELLQRQPGIALKVLEFAAEQLEQARATIHGLSSSTAEQRIARALLRLLEKHGEEHEDGQLIQLPLPQQDLAAMTGTTVETVSRVLSQFRHNGLVTTGRRWVAVTDEAGLEALAGH